MIVPGVGFAGLGQMTRASQSVFARGARRSAPRVRGRARRTSARLTRRMAQTTPRGSKRYFKTRKSRSRSKPARLVRGSAAAKRYMAKIRKMRKR